MKVHDCRVVGWLAALCWARQHQLAHTQLCNFPFDAFVQERASDLVLVQKLGVQARRRPDLPPRAVRGGCRGRRGGGLRGEQLPATRPICQCCAARVPLRFGRYADKCQWRNKGPNMG